MTVSDLIQLLEKMPQELEVIYEDYEYGSGPITEVGVYKAPVRGKNDVVYIA